MDYAAVRESLLAETRAKIAESVTDDVLVIQAVSTKALVEQSLNSLVKKGREWLGLTIPEVEHMVKDHERLLELYKKGQRALLKEFSVKGTMGASLEEEDEEALASFIASVRALYEEREQLQQYIDKKMNKIAPNVSVIAGGSIGAQLLAHAGSLERLSAVSSSTIQLYGAETALFRHLHNKKKHRSPKYGLLYHHPLVQQVAAKDRGKAARALADKLSLCAKVDFFKGESCGTKFKVALEKKFGVQW